MLTLNRDVLHQAVKSIARAGAWTYVGCGRKRRAGEFLSTSIKQDTTQMLQYVSAFPHNDEIESKVARRFLSKIATNIDDKSTLMEMAAGVSQKPTKQKNVHSLTALCTAYL